MGNPDAHDHANLPILVAGGGAGKLKGARHLKYEKATPLANVHLTLLDKVGVHLDSFADSKGESPNCWSRFRCDTVLQTAGTADLRGSDAGGGSAAMTPMAQRRCTGLFTATMSRPRCGWFAAVQM